MPVSSATSVFGASQHSQDYVTPLISIKLPCKALDNFFRLTWQIIPYPQNRRSTQRTNLMRSPLLRKARIGRIAIHDDSLDLKVHLTGSKTG
jgi:hypothetical protein